jgi:arginase
VSVLLVPYHLDEPLPDLDLPARPDRVLTAELRGEHVWDRVAGLYETVADAVAGTDRPVLLTGDCTTALGMVAGLQRQDLDPAVVWFDAHGDLRTPESTTSGYLGGMPLRMLLGEGDTRVATRTGLRPVPAERVVLVDGRDLDPAEVEFLAGSAVRRVPVEAVPAPDGPIYLHIDLDVVDPAGLPGLRYPASGGPDLDSVRDAVLRLLATGRVVGLTLACTWYAGHGAADVVRPLAEALRQRLS